MIYKNLAHKEFMEHKWKLLVGVIILSVAGAVLPITFDYMGDILGLIGEELPGGIGNQLSQEISFYFSNYDIYIWSQWNAKNLTQIVAIISLLLGATSIASEVNKGTIEFLLTKPVNKSKVLTSKIVVSLGVIFLLIAVPTLITLLTSLVTGKGGFGEIVILGLIPAYLGMVVIYFVGLIFSTISNDAIKAFAYGAGVIMLNSMLGFLKATQKFSLSYHYKGVEYVLNETFPLLSTVILVMIIGILAFISYSIFTKKEY